MGPGLVEEAAMTAEEVSGAAPRKIVSSGVRDPGTGHTASV